MEGDAFNRVLVDRSRTRIRAPGLLQGRRRQEHAGQPSPTAPMSPSRSPNNPPARCSWAWVIPRHSKLIGEFSYTEQNLFGRGQYPEGRRSRSRRSAKQYTSSASPSPISSTGRWRRASSFTRSQTDYQQATYRERHHRRHRVGWVFRSRNIPSSACTTPIKSPQVSALRRRAAGNPAGGRAAPMARSSATPMATTTWTMPRKPTKGVAF